MKISYIANSLWMLLFYMHVLLYNLDNVNRIKNSPIYIYNYTYTLYMSEQLQSITLNFHRTTIPSTCDSLSHREITENDFSLCVTWAFSFIFEHWLSGHVIPWNISQKAISEQEYWDFSFHLNDWIPIVRLFQNQTSKAITNEIIIPSHRKELYHIYSMWCLFLWNVVTLIILRNKIDSFMCFLVCPPIALSL